VIDVQVQWLFIKDKKMASAKPNFLFIMTDQQRADHLGCYGNRILTTPHIDGIAKSGVTFDKFYVANSTCMPNRATLITGRMPSVNGVLTNGQCLDVQSNTFVHLLRQDGYRTALFGKCHLQNGYNHRIDDWNYPTPQGGRPPPEGYTDSHLHLRSGQDYESERGDLWQKNPEREINGPYYGFEEVKFCNAHGDGVHGHYTAWARNKHPNFDSLIGPTNAQRTDSYVNPIAWRTQVPEELYSTTFVEEMTTQFLQSQKKSDKPFFIQCSFNDPHHPFTPPGSYWGRYDPDSVALPASHGATHNAPPPLQKKLQDALDKSKRKDIRVEAFACTEREAREGIALTYDMITMVDDAIGRLLQRLQDLGLAENTVVVFTSDHGDLMGDHGLMLKHCFHTEGTIRVPFIWSDPTAAEKHNTRTEMLGGTIDIAATILGRAGLQPYHGMQGQDVIGCLNEDKEPNRLGMVLEEDELPFNAGTDVFMRTRSFVTGPWRISYWLEDNFGELYNRNDDPDEINNLWDDPTVKKEKADLIEMWMLERMALEDIAPRSIYCA
jgi:arylsulfatase A-like enzyme